MLYGIPPLLGPDLLHALRAMGHGDELVISDANYPATSNSNRLVRLDGLTATEVADAVLGLMPLDTFVDAAAFRMEVVGKPDEVPPVCREFEAIVARRASGMAVASLERFAFYERAAGAFVTIATGDERLYANLILKKGIIPPGEG